ncbi:phosphoadenylyl-sulfate reductase [Oricola thermophila]|uniref:phosphoadenylyl-sulfate reductase n=1 Tax=Oricola thermophila TaxID=2742145 RepID=UPI001FEC9804|nr:phosphoadenylyl-sulfate reductase [Oricola thermophila]
MPHDSIKLKNAEATPASGQSSLAHTRAVLREVLVDKKHGEIAVVSSFGAESAVLLHLIAEANPAAPVIFINTRMLFAETLAYKDELVSRLGLTDVRTVAPDSRTVREIDPNGRLHRTDPDACCDFRKTQVLSNALEGFDGWITGRKRFQAVTRESVDIFERSRDGKLKVNPLAYWSKEDVKAHFAAFDLPQHPLVSHGYLSIGCAVCTSPVKNGEDERAGRWRGLDKTECGIHFENGKLVRSGDAGAWKQS